MGESEAIPIIPAMAKPGIPVEAPKRREIPDITYPIPERIPLPIPAPAGPIRITPREPVPTR